MPREFISSDTTPAGRKRLGPDVTRTRSEDAEAAYANQLNAAGLASLAPTETWTVEGSNRANSYATHGIFRYYGKYPPPIGRELIAEYTDPGEWVVDPTCGSGSTGVEAILAGRQAQLFDVNPIAIHVAGAKTTHVPLAESEEAIRIIQGAYAPATKAEFANEPVGLRNPDHWFLEETGDSLRGLDRALQSLEEGPVSRLMRVAYLATIRRCSRATTQQGRLFLDAETALPDGLETFLRFAKRAAKAVSQLPEDHVVTIASHDARKPLPIPTNVNPALLLLHPPYFNAYKYSRINSLELAWSGINPAEIRQREIREFFKIGKPENAEKYVQDMHDVAGNAVNAVRPGGVVAIMMGDTRLRDEHIPVTRDLLVRLCETHPVDLEKVVLRIPRHTEASWVASQRRRSDQLGVPLCDYIAILRRHR